MLPADLVATAERLLGGGGDGGDGDGDADLVHQRRHYEYTHVKRPVGKM